MLMYRTRCCLAIIFLILIDGPVYAEWVALEDQYQSHPLQTVYIDPDTLHRESHVVTISALIDWKAMQGGRTPTRFYSTKLTKQFHCTQTLVRTVAATDYYGHMGTDEVIGGGGHMGADQWMAIEPGTINQGLWEAACGKGNKVSRGRS